MHIMHTHTRLNNANRNLSTQLLISFMRVAGSKLLNKTLVLQCMSRSSKIYAEKLNSAARLVVAAKQQILQLG